MSRALGRPIAAYAAAGKKRISAAAGRLRDPLTLLAAALFLAGLLAGTLYIRKGSGDLARYLAAVAKNQIVRRCERGFLHTAVGACAANAAVTLLCCVLANCAVGAPPLAAALFCTGAGIGLLSGFYYKEFAFQGVLLNLLLVALPKLPFAAAMALLGGEGFRLSAACFASAYLRRGGINPAADRFLAALPRCLVLLFVSGLLEGFLYLLFGSLVV